MESLHRSLMIVMSIGALSGMPVASQSAPAASRADSNIDIAIFAGGCFWTMETKFDHVPGVVDVVSGATGARPGQFTEDDFAKGRTGAVEAVQVKFDRSKISYRKLVDQFWRMIDPTDTGGQACDRGPNYLAAVFVTPQQRAEAEASRFEAAARIGTSRFATPIRPVSKFYPAPAYHQDFAKLNPDRYARYDRGCGRAERLRAIWEKAGGKP